MTIDPFYTWQTQIHPDNKFFLEEDDIDDIFIDALIERLQRQGNRKPARKKNCEGDKFKQLKIIDAILLASQKA